MPTISTETIFFGSTQFKRIVKVDAGGTFTTELPSDVGVALGYTSVSASSKHEVIKKFNDALKEFSASRATITKVLLFSFEAKVRAEGSDGAMKWEERNMSFCKGAALDVCAVVARKILTEIPGGKVQKRYERIPSGIRRCMEPDRMESFGHHWTEVEWSQEAEDLMVRIGVAMEMVVENLRKLRQPANLLAAAAAGTGLLPEKSGGGQ